MALSGSTTVTATTTTSGNVGDSLKFSWTATQSVANNASSVAWKLELAAGSAGYISSSASKSWSVTVNGTKYSGSNTIGIANNATKTLASGTTSVPHNADGTKSFSYSFSQQFSITFGGKSVGTVSGSGSGTLDTIARASTFGSVSGATIGSACTVTITKASSSFAHRVWYKVGGSSWYDLGKTADTTVKFTIAMETCSQYPNAATGAMQLCVRTYKSSSDDTQIGSDVYKSVTVSIPDSVAPTCTVSVSDAAGYASTYGGYLVGLSRLKVTVGTATAYGSEIKSYSISANGETGTVTPYTTGAVKSAGTLAVSVSVTDGRGRKGTASATVTALDYSAPRLTLAVHRCTSDGTEDMSGAYIKVSYEGSITALGGKNAVKAFQLEYKKSSAASYTSSALSTSALSGSKVVSADGASSYDVRLTLTDNLTSTVRTTSASTAMAILHFGANGDRVGIGTMAEKPGLTVGWDTGIDGELSTTGTITAAGFRVPELQGGYLSSVSAAANAVTTVSVTFSKAFSAAPNVVCTLYASVSNTAYDALTLVAKGATTTGFTLQVINTASYAMSPNVCWLAFY